MKVNSNEAITVDYKEIEESSIRNKDIEEKYLVDKSLITNSEKGNILNELKKRFNNIDLKIFVASNEK